MADRTFSIIYPENIHGNSFSLNDDESHHLGRVLRKKSGDTVWLIDGQGMAYEGLIEELHPKVSGKIIKSHKQFGENPRDVHLVLAILKRTALETAIEQATEMGARSVTLLITERIVKKQFNLTRLEKIVRSSSKQCGRSQFMEINGPVTLNEWTKSINYNSSTVFGCHWIGESSISSVLKNSVSSIYCLIGPEGDFSSGEIEILQNNNIPFATLGNRRLRAETAVSTALSVINETMLGRNS